MITVNIKARIKRTKFDTLAGSNFRDETSELIKYLNSVGKKSLLGIQREDGIYTVIGHENIYYSTLDGTEGQISHSDFLQILKANALDWGKSGKFEFVKLNDRDAFWLKDAQIMNTMWNTVMLIDESRERC